MATRIFIGGLECIAGIGDKGARDPLTLVERSPTMAVVTIPR